MKVHGSIYRHACPICDSRALSDLWRIPFSRVATPVVVSGATIDLLPLLDADSTVYSYALCRECGAIFMSPYASEKASYRESRYHVGRLDDAAVMQGYRDQWRTYIRPWLRESDRVLFDAGCGAGQYLLLAAEDEAASQDEAKPTRWEKLIGCELSRNSVESVVARGGRFSAFQADLDGPGCFANVPALALGSVDFIVFSEVFEHTEQPRIVLANLVGALRPGGRIFLTAQSTEGKLPVRPGEPIYATRRGIEGLLTAVGLDILSIMEAAGRWKIVAERGA